MSLGCDLSVLEELTSNAKQIQDDVLTKILKANANTEYLSCFLEGSSEKELFKKNVPVVSYEDVKPYIDRVVSQTENPQISFRANRLLRFSGENTLTMAECDMQKNVNETHNFYVENLLDVRRKNHGTVFHSKIHYINAMSTTTSSLFNSLNRTESLATKSYHKHKQQQQQESNTKLQNRQQPNDLSSQGFRHLETNSTVKIQDKQVNNTYAKFQLKKRRSHRWIYQTLKTAQLKSCDDQLHQNSYNRRSNR
uniref:Uncharacterized protein n=1 Tax=Brassica oleracea var. oleracea TaxID=109376 RepID=A0A0D3DY46_BRAOL